LGGHTSAGSRRAPAERPNIVFIFADQWRGDALGHLGIHPPLRTPVVDALVAGGVRFGSCATPNPVCVPAREAVVTGRWGHRVPGGGCLDNGGPRFRAGVPTFPRLLQEAGYVTHTAGKQHFQPVRDHRGYGRMELSEGQPAYRQDDDYLLSLRDAGYGSLTQPGGDRGPAYYLPQESPLAPEHHMTAWTAERCVAFIRANRNRPFLCTAAFFKPHPPFDPPRAYWDRYSPESVSLPLTERRQDEEDAFLPVQNRTKAMDAPDEARARAVRSAYYALLEQIDDGIGRIVETLRECGVLDNTLIVISADHGELLGDHGAWGKRSFYQGSVTVPLILHWPAGLPGGVVRETPVSTLDLFPTFASACRLAVPEPVDGLDLLAHGRDGASLERGGVAAEFGTDRRFKLMWRWQESGGGQENSTGPRQWKYVWLSNGGREQLFDLTNDPLESRNVVSVERARCAAAHDALVRWARATGFEGALSETSGGPGNRLVSIPFEPLPLGDVNKQAPVWPARDPDFGPARVVA
jgi:arylsulfatase